MQGGKTGWPPGLLQDDCRALSRWFESRLGAKRQVRENMMAMNMSYCRFENTLEALRECNEALAGSNNPLDELSEAEGKAARRLFKLCGELAADYGEDA